jgi:sugar/nucleoside kinase (ribokinase family)
MLDLIVVGHLTVDTIMLPQNNKPQKMIGGAVVYTSLAAKSLDSKVAIISKVGKDLPDKYIHWLKQQSIDLSNLKLVNKAKTTQFILKYTNSEKRQLWLKTKAPQITLKDIPNTLKAKAIHIGTVTNELSLSIIKKLRNYTELISLDPQGFLRRPDKTGKITLQPINNIKNLLENIDIYKSSFEEARILTKNQTIEKIMKRINSYGVKTVIVTKGSKGATLLHEEKIYQIPTYPAKTVNPTGAGDSFIGAFLAAYTRKKVPSWCACVGVAAASIKIEKVRPTDFSQDEIYKRASEIHKKLKSRSL